MRLVSRAWEAAVLPLNYTRVRCRFYGGFRTVRNSATGASRPRGVQGEFTALAGDWIRVREALRILHEPSMEVSRDVVMRACHAHSVLVRDCSWSWCCCRD